MNLDQRVVEYMKEHRNERNQQYFTILLELSTLVQMHHNDADLGREVRKLVNKNDSDSI